MMKNNGGNILINKSFEFQELRSELISFKIFIFLNEFPTLFYIFFDVVIILLFYFC